MNLLAHTVQGETVISYNTIKIINTVCGRQHTVIQAVNIWGVLLQVYHCGFSIT